MPITTVQMIYLESKSIPMMSDPVSLSTAVPLVPSKLIRWILFVFPSSMYGPSPASVDAVFVEGERENT